jgi:hypothetical protein
MRVKYFFDTEFIERPGLLDLISIGISCEDGRELYAISSEFDETQCNDWVKANVLPKLNGHVRESRISIRKRILAFIGKTTPEFWAYFADYDWVLFCWIFGSMTDLPQGWPMFCLDLKQEMYVCDIALTDLPSQSDENEAHEALIDARWLRAAYKVVMSRRRTRFSTR